MRLFRHKDEEEAGGIATAMTPGHKRYKMKERMFSFGDDYFIEDEAGNRAFKVDGKMLRLRSTLVIRDSEGHEVAKIQERKLRVRDTMKVEQDDRTVATVKKALVSPLRERYSIEVEQGQDLEAKGNIVDHEFEIKRGGETVAEVSKRWFRARDTYGIEIAPGEDDALILIVAVCIDRMGRRD